MPANEVAPRYLCNGVSFSYPSVWEPLGAVSCTWWGRPKRRNWHRNEVPAGFVLAALFRCLNMTLVRMPDQHSHSFIWRQSAAVAHADSCFGSTLARISTLRSDRPRRAMKKWWFRLISCFQLRATRTGRCRPKSFGAPNEDAFGGFGGALPKQVGSASLEASA